MASASRILTSEATASVSRAIIVESSGTHFDPSVVEAFCELEEQFREVRDSMEA